jgi:hypothetical protein
MLKMRRNAAAKSALKMCISCKQMLSPKRFDAKLSNLSCVECCKKEDETEDDEEDRKKEESVEEIEARKQRRKQKNLEARKKREEALAKEAADRKRTEKQVGKRLKTKIVLKNRNRLRS